MRRGIWAARATGCLIGATAALVLLITSRPTEGGEAIGAEVSAHADLNGELALSPAGPANFIHERALRPGDVATGTVLVRNQTGQRQDVRVWALGSTPALDQALELSFAAGDRQLRAGTLGDLAAKGGGAVVLAPGESTEITTTASIRAGAPAGWEAALVDVAVLFDSTDSPGGG
ncbi:MAG: hypothetical protein M3M99_01690 [Actinomycetota bacterium]|nr:hypothetical protein [Actinomycetota bacterium]